MIKVILVAIILLAKLERGIAFPISSFWGACEIYVLSIPFYHVPYI